MIKIKVNYEDNFITGFKITGHANYDDYGKDIVCASVSSIAITSCNMALSINPDSIEIIQKEGLIDCNVLVKDEIINKVFENMLNMLKELETNYKNNVKIL